MGVITPRSISLFGVDLQIVEWTPPEFDRAMCHLFATDIFGDQGVTFSEAM